ncbi:hypothetical protein VWH97_05380 [Escherichia coli O157]|nr:hypothetical protein [Escherichia coli O157]
MISDLLNIDITKLKITDCGMCVNDKRKIDYAILTDGNKSLWYDKSVGIQFRHSSSIEKYSETLDYISNGSIIYVKYSESGKITNTITFNEKKYTEEEFFMVSTLYDFGCIRYCDYVKTLDISNKIYSILEQYEKEIVDDSK